VARRDIEKAELVGARRIISHGAGHRIASIAQFNEIDAFDDTAVFDVETGDETGFKHQAA
jgi:hypothetical protein